MRKIVLRCAATASFLLYASTVIAGPDTLPSIPVKLPAWIIRFFTGM